MQTEEVCPALAHVRADHKRLKIRVERTVGTATVKIDGVGDAVGVSEAAAAVVLSAISVVDRKAAVLAEATLGALLKCESTLTRIVYVVALHQTAIERTDKSERSAA
jgi:hypothetical protein